MKRDLAELSRNRFDLLVVGGGIYGAVAAWDAALRGLSVALIERGDFGGATSQNSLKVIHGGLRYLQDGNLSRIRSMAKERSTWMKIAPHLVHPLTCLTPTYAHPSRGRLALKIALGLNDLLSYDRNRMPDEGKHLPVGRVISKEECARLLPGLDIHGITGAAVWHDAQMHNSERLLLSFVLSANREGAVVANYVEAVGFLRKETTVRGVIARDVLTAQEFDIQAKVVLNCTGAWIDHLLGSLGKPAPRPRFAVSVGLNLVVDQVWEGYAAGLPSHPEKRSALDRSSRRSQVLFIVPWRKYSLIGTWHIPWLRPAEAFTMNEAVLQEFIAAVNRTHPGLNLSMKDIQHVHYGFLPMIASGSREERVRLVREGQVIDHEVEDGLTGLISLVGVKYTTARALAQNGVDLAVRKLGLKGLPCRTHKVPIAGGEIERFKEFLDTAQARRPANLRPEVVEHLIYTYGSQYDCLLDYLHEQPRLGEQVTEESPVLKAEIVHAVRREMAQSLVDVVQRRTELGATGLPTLSTLQTCAHLVGQELNWDAERKARAIDEVRLAYPI